MKYADVGTVQQLRSDSDGVEVMLKLDGTTEKGWSRFQHITLNHDQVRAERITFGDRINVGWEPVVPSPEPETVGPALDLAEQAIASSRRLMVICWTQAAVIAALLGFLTLRH